MVLTSVLRLPMVQAWVASFGEAKCPGFDRQAKRAVEAALQNGQAAAAVNCGFLGARGAMQALTLGKRNERLSTLVACPRRLVQSEC